MLSTTAPCLVVVLLLSGLVISSPLHREEEAGPLSALAHAGHVAGGAGHAAPRLPGVPGLPSPQELEAIKKVAQILVMLGEQVIPTIIGDPSSSASSSSSVACCDGLMIPAAEVPPDPVNN